MGEEFENPLRRNWLQDRVAQDDFILFADSAERAAGQMVNQERKWDSEETACRRQSLAREAEGLKTW